MKKGIKLTLSVLMVLSVLMSVALTAAAVEANNSYLEASKFVITDGTVSNASQPIVKDGKLTFKINVSSGVTLTSALVTVKYDKTVLRVVDAGPSMKTDAEGNESEIVSGMHTHGVPKYDDSAYTFAYISSSGFPTGSTGKEFAFITFEVINKNCPNTTVEFVTGDYNSTETIKKFDGQKGNGFSTLNSGEVKSFTAGDKSLTLTWDEVPGATEYWVLRKLAGNSGSFSKIAETTDISYKDSEDIANNTAYSYAIVPVNANGNGWYVGKSYTYMDTTKVTVTNASTGVKVAWDKVDGATDYRVYRRLQGGTWETVDTVDANTLSITDKKISSGKIYEYTVRVFKDSSVSAAAKVQKIQYVQMVSTLTLANSAKGVSIKWNKVAGAEQYRVYRKLSGESTWTTIKTVGPDVTSLVDTAAVSGKTNYFAVKVYSNGAWSALKSAGFNYLAAPKITKTSSAIGTGITIKWDAVPGAAQYRIYRKTSASGSWSLITKTTNTSYTDKNVTTGKNYIYTLKAENGNNISGYDSTGWTVKYTIGTPSVSSVTTSTKAITIKWGAVKGTTGYIVYRKPAGASSWTRLTTTTATSYTDSKVKAGTVYYYTVKAYKGSSTSGYNKTGWAGVILSTPTVKSANASNGIKVSWSKVSGAAGYTVYSSQYVNGKWTSWKSRGTAGAEKFSWVDKSVKSGETCRYTVRAVNGLCKSSYKASASLVYLAQPTVTIANAASGITVKWTKSAGASNYVVYRAQFDEELGSWSSWTNLGKVASSKTSWTDVNAVNGITYRYTVRASKGSVMSTYKASNESMFLTIPELISCSVDTSGNVLEFEANANAESYRIYRKTLYTSWTLLETVSGSDDCVYTDSNIISGTEYIYTVRAVNGDSVSYYDVNGISCMN